MSLVVCCGVDGHLHGVVRCCCSVVELGRTGMAEERCRECCRRRVLRGMLQADRLVDGTGHRWRLGR